VKTIIAVILIIFICNCGVGWESGGERDLFSPGFTCQDGLRPNDKCEGD